MVEYQEVAEPHQVVEVKPKTSIDTGAIIDMLYPRG
jgi:hypothetical protein